jgi:mono/diheme cytochrome c family protein
MLRSWLRLACNVALLAGAVVGASCSSSSSSAPGPKFTIDNYPQPTAANAVGKTDPLWEGQYYALYETWGTETFGGWPTDFLLKVLKDEPTFFGNQFERFGYIPDANDDLPIGLKRGTVDVTLTAQTCAACHTGRLPDGTIWFGAPNLQIDSMRLDFELNKRWVAAGNTSRMSDATAARATAYGPGRFRIDSDGYPHAVAANIPVHYDLGQRSHLSTVGGLLDVRSDAYMALGADFDFPLSADATKIPFPDDAKIQKMVDFMGSHHPPPAPAQDATLVAKGKDVFHTAQCDACHHTDDVSKDGVTKVDDAATGMDRIPGADPAWPEGSVHTDPYQFYMAFGDPSMPGSGGIDPRTVNIIKFGYEHKLNVGISDGYVAPNLHGLWASAPYLNNGSVPTLNDLLSKASARPATFKIGDFSFDTTVPGNGNQGHELETDLTADDKTALVAYLNSL